MMPAEAKGRGETSIPKGALNPLRLMALGAIGCQPRTSAVAKAEGSIGGVGQRRQQVSSR